MSPPQVHLPVSDLSPQAVQASQQSLMGHVCCGAFVQCSGDSATDLQVPSPSQLDRARTRDKVGLGIISGT